MKQISTAASILAGSRRHRGDLSHQGFAVIARQDEPLVALLRCGGTLAEQSGKRLTILIADLHPQGNPIRIDPHFSHGGTAFSPRVGRQVGLNSRHKPQQTEQPTRQAN
jgi:hypothetical protein